MISDAGAVGGRAAAAEARDAAMYAQGANAVDAVSHYDHAHTLRGDNTLENADGVKYRGWTPEEDDEPLTTMPRRADAPSRTQPLPSREDVAMMSVSPGAPVRAGGGPARGARHGAEVVRVDGGKDIHVRARQHGVGHPAERRRGALHRRFLDDDVGVRAADAERR